MNPCCFQSRGKLPWGKSMETLAEKGYMGDSLLFECTTDYLLCVLCADERRPAACYDHHRKRQQGITLILTVAATAMELGVPEEKMLRAIAFAQAINLYAKHYLGTLSCLCSCSVASGLSASAGIVYMMGGSDQQVLDTMRNVFGKYFRHDLRRRKGRMRQQGLLIYRAVCYVSHDGAQWHEYQAADGILADNLKDLFTNLGNIANVGMAPANAAIVDIMLKNRAINKTG